MDSSIPYRQADHSSLEKRKYEKHQKEIGANTIVTLDDLFSKIESENLKQLNLIVKADVQGSVEAVKQSLEKLSNEEVRVKVIHSNVGGVTESDVTLARVSGAIIIGFNVRPDVIAKSIADKEGVEIKQYSVIYDAINDVEAAIKRLNLPVIKSKCPANENTRREDVKNLIKQLNEQYEDVPQKIIGAIKRSHIDNW